MAMLADERRVADLAELGGLWQNVLGAERCKAFLADAEDALRTATSLRHGHRQSPDETISEQVKE